MSDQLLAIVLVAVMLACAIAVGSRVLAMIRAEPAPLERMLFGLGLGVGVQGTLLLGLAAAGWMHPLLLWGAVVVPAAFAAGEFRRFPEMLHGARNVLAGNGAVERVVVAVVLVAIGVVLIVGALSPVMDWDSLMYHLQLPRLFLEAGRLHVPADGLHVAYLGLFQFLYLPLLALGATAGASLLNAAMAFALALAVAAAGTRLFDRSTGLLAFIALWGSSSVILVATTPRVDVTLILLLFLAHYAVLVALRGDGAWGVMLASLLAGVAIGLKYHALPYLAALAPFAMWALWRVHAGRVSRVARAAGLGVLVALAIASPWLLKNQIFFGGALYPFGAERVVPPFIADIQGSSAHPESVSQGIYGALGQARQSISLKGLLFNPASLTVENEGLSYTRNWVAFAAPLALLFVRDRLVLALLLPGIAYLAFALGFFAKTNLRYLMPVLPAMVLLGAEAARRLGERLGRPRITAPALVFIAVLALLPALRVVSDRLLSVERVKVAIGLEPPVAMLRTHEPFLVAQWFTEFAPPDAKVLMLFDARGFYFERATIQDNVLTNWPLLVGTGSPERCLAGTGITHVYLNRGVAGYYRARGLDLDLLSWAQFAPFAQRCLTPQVQTGGIAIYEVRRQ